VIPTCDHEWTVVGYVGPFPVEECSSCRTAALVPVDGENLPVDSLDEWTLLDHPEEAS